MKYELIARTDKAEIYRLSNGSVLKRYLTDNATTRVQHDQHSLRFIEEHFGNVEYEGWAYRTVKLRQSTVNGRALYMEYVSGHALSATPKTEINRAEYHCGIWIAFYHNRVLNGKSEGFIYTDFIIHNIIIDFDQKCITAIDPGMLWGRMGNRYEDIILHIQSVLTSLVIPNKASFAAIFHFLRGYARATHATFSLNSYYIGLFRQLHERAKHYQRTSLPKLLAFAVSTAIFSPLYIVVAPAYLFLKRGDGGGEAVR